MPEEKPEKDKKTEEPKDSWFRVNGTERTEEEFCSWIQDQVKKHPVVKVHHGKWKELIEWREGNQFTRWSDEASKVVPVVLSARKRQIVINLIKPLLETIEGKVNFFHKIAGMANSAEGKDIYGSKVATRLIDYNDYVCNTPDIMEDMKYDLFNTGNACQKWIYDKTMSSYMAPKVNGKPDDSKRQRIDGDVRGTVVPIFNIRPDPTAKVIEECRWFIEIKEVTVQDILATYKIPKEKLDIETETGGTTGDKYVGMNEPEEEKDKDEKTRIVCEYWERPNKWYEDGRFIVTIDNIVAHAGKNPNPDGEIPYFMYYYHKTPYSFWAKGPIHFVQDIQREFNRMVSIITEHIEAWRPKMTVGQGALKTKGSMTVDSFEIVEVDYSRGEPRAMQMPQLQPQVTEFRDFLVASIDRVSNIHEVSYSRLPQYASRAPASLYSMMLEQENLKLNPMVSNWNSSIIKQATFRLKLMDKYYDHPRMVKIMGENKKTQIAYFGKADLAQNFDIRLEIGVTLNQSTTVQLRSLIEFYDKGIITDKNKIIRAANLGMAEQEFTTDVADSERAMRENQAFQDGTQKELRIFPLPDVIMKQLSATGIELKETEVYIHDDHAVHMGIHTDLMKSEDADKWPEDRFQALDKHIMIHLIYLSAEAKVNAQKEAEARPQQTATPGFPGTQQPGPMAENEGAGAPVAEEMEAGGGQMVPPNQAV